MSQKKTLQYTENPLGGVLDRQLFVGSAQWDNKVATIRDIKIQSQIPVGAAAKLDHNVTIIIGGKSLTTNFNVSNGSTLNWTLNDIGAAEALHTHKYAGSSIEGGSATSAEALTSASVGSTTQPVYFDASGKPVATTHSLGASVPSNAVFTDTNTTYTVATGDNNGTIKVTPSTGAAYSVSVKGLNSAAYIADNTLVHKTGNETITGIKTFTNDVNLGSSTNTWTIDGLSGSYFYINANGGTSYYLPKGADGVTKEIATVDHIPGGTVTAVTADSPLTSTGGTTPKITLNTAYGDTLNPYGAKAKNLVLAGPTTGSNAAPTFRSLVLADLPSSATANRFLKVGTANTAPSYSQIGFTDLPTGTGGSEVAIGNHIHNEYLPRDEEIGIGVIYNLLVNSSGYSLWPTFTLDSSHMVGEDYPYQIILDNNNNPTETRARVYLRHMLGNKYLPEFNYEYPRNSLLIDADGNIWKPQWTDAGGGVYELRIYAMANPFRVKVATTSTLGGIKAATKGMGDTVEAKIGSDDKLYVPTYPTTLPASDVYSWAKASSKPSYTASEVGARASDWTPAFADLPTGTGANQVAVGNHTHSEYLTSHQSLANYVNRSTAQIIAGNKRFTGISILENSAIPFYVKRLNNNSGGIYAGGIFEKGTSGTAGVANEGIGFYFKSRDTAGNMDHVGLVGGRLTVATSGSEVGEILLNPAHNNTDPFNRPGMRVRAVSNTIADVYTTGNFYANAGTTGTTGDKVATETWVGNNAVTLTDNQIIDGIKTFKQDIEIGQSLVKWTLDGINDSYFEIKASGGTSYQLSKGSSGVTRQIATINRGDTASRPTLGVGDMGFLYFNMSTNKPNWWTGFLWVDATGTSV